MNNKRSQNIYSYVLGEHLKFLGSVLENFAYTSLKNKNFMTKKLNNNKCVK